MGFILVTLVKCHRYHRDRQHNAAGGVQRAGFERMVAQVCLGKVGAVAAREVSRFARNSRDWQQLIEMWPGEWLRGASLKNQRATTPLKCQKCPSNTAFSHLALRETPTSNTRSLGKS